MVLLPLQLAAAMPRLLEALRESLRPLLEEEDDMLHCMAAMLTL